MKFSGFTAIAIIVAAICILFYMVNYGVSMHAVPSLQEFIASTTIASSFDSTASSTQATSTTLGTLVAPEVTISNASSSSTNKNSPSYSIFRAPRSTFRVTTARTPATRELGLSGRASLAPDEGLLFIFPQPVNTGFWMKDMKFSIDIVWIDSDRRVVGIAEDVSPSSYPNSFYPPQKVQFVLEVNAGDAKKSGLAEGTTVVF